MRQKNAKNGEMYFSKRHQPLKPELRQELGPCSLSDKTDLISDTDLTATVIYRYLIALNKTLIKAINPIAFHVSFVLITSP